MKKLFFMLLAVLISPVSLMADGVLWPLSIEISQSSSFAEFRGMRFHAGIDLRTQQKNGFPVRAIADGFISRASVQFRGYGYALYIDHPSLETRVVYGHLQDFTGPLKEYVDGKLKKMGQRFGINDFFSADRFPVKKGQVVALSGDTGVGPSHLHFELRTLQDEPIAPAVFGFRPSDSIYPVFHSFYLEPMEHLTVINDSFLPATIELKNSKKGSWTLESSPKVFGKVAMQAGISDTNGAGNRYGVERITLRSVDKTLVERVFHKFSYADNNQCPWVYDYFKSNMKNTGYVYNFFKWPFDTLPFAADYPAWSGCVASSDFIDGKFSFSLQASDYGNNTIDASGMLTAENIAFDPRISEEQLAACNFAKIAQTNFSLIAIGTFAKNDNRKTEYGRVAVKDRTGKSSYQPCIIRSGFVEIAFEQESRWQGGAWIGERRILPETTFIDKAGGELHPGNGARVEFPAGSVNFPVFAAMTIVDSAPGFGGDVKRGWLQPYSPVWSLSPDNVVFNSEVKLMISPNSYSGDIKKLGIYNVNAPGKYSYNGEKSAGGNLTFTAITGGKYVILEDQLPPAVSYSRQIDHYNLGKCYVFKVSDIGKGVDYLGAWAEINGVSTEVYSDPDKAEIYVVKPDKTLPHRITLKIADHAQNVKTTVRTIKK